MTLSASLPPRLDLLKLTINLGGNREAVHRLSALYLRSTETSLTAMENAMATRDVAEWMRVAHQIKGSSQNMTALRMAQLALEAETIDGLPHANALSVLYHMQKELALVREEMALVIQDL